MTRNERNEVTMFPYNQKFPREEKFIREVRSVVPFVPLADIDAMTQQTLFDHEHAAELFPDSAA